MKKIFTIMALCLSVMCAYAQNYTLRTLTFEDADYVSTTPNYLGFYNWSSLIDSPQYGGDLLYGENHGDTTQQYSDVNYRWYDNGNTYLYSELPENWGTKMYWGGGHAISNYWNGNLSDGDYSHQLSVYVPNNSGNGQGGHGHNGSNNFCVHYGYHDDSGYSADNLPFICFADSVERTIQGMYIDNTTYFVNSITNGNGLTTSLSSTQYVRVVATGYKLDGTQTESVSKNLAVGNSFINDWDYWNLSDLSSVYKVTFNIVSNCENEYGMSQPAYFCYDDVTVRVNNEEGSFSSAIMTRQNNASQSDESLRCFTVTTDPDGCVLSGDVPTDVKISLTHNGKSSLQHYLHGGDNNIITIEGLSPNMEIQKIETNIFIDDLFGISEITASIGDNEIAKLSMQGLFAGADESFIIAENDKTYELSLDESVSHLCTDNLIITQTCAAEYAGTHYFNIYYTLSDATGISNVIDSDNERKDNSYYSLGGTRVANPTKGLYIHNGKKILIK